MAQASYVPNAIRVHIPDASRISSTNDADRADLSVHADLSVCLATLLCSLQHAEKQTEWRVA